LRNSRQHPDHPWLRAQQGEQMAPGQVAQVRGAPGKADGQAAWPPRCRPARRPIWFITAPWSTS